jgi:hypothetical protein
MQILKIQERIEPDQEKIQELIDDWHLVVCQHLAEIANATWGEKIEGRFSWILKGKVIWSEESQTPFSILARFTQAALQLCLVYRRTANGPGRITVAFRSFL